MIENPQVPYNTFLLTSNHIEQILVEVGIDKFMLHLIEALDTAVCNYDKKKIDIPVRSGFNYHEPYHGLIEWMPLHDKSNSITIKIVGYHPKNPSAFNLPSVLSTIYNFDVSNGHLTSIIDGVLPTALRTGAASAVASRLMAKGESKRLGLIGCGAQSITQLHALSLVFDLEEVYYFDTDILALNSFKERSECMIDGIKLVPSAISEIIDQCDIVSTATSVEVGNGPLFENLKYPSSLHINAVGADFPGKFEMPLDLLKQSVVIPDFLEQALLEGECEQLNIQDIGPELHLIAKNKERYESLKDKLTVFDSTGYPLEDKVVSELFLKFAKDLNIGQEIAIENILIDVKNPYGFLSDSKNYRRVNSSLIADKLALES